MTSDRPYREAMPSRVARMRLAQAVGSQFDTSVVAAFEAILATADEAYRLGRRRGVRLGSRTPIRVTQRVRSPAWPSRARFESLEAPPRRATRTPSFSKMWRTWTLTVTGLMNRVRPISAFDSPCATRARTSFSRGESDITDRSLVDADAGSELDVPGSCENALKRRVLLAVLKEAYQELGAPAIRRDERLDHSRVHSAAESRGCASERFFLVVLIEGADGECAVRCDTALYPDRGFECRRRDLC